MRIQCFILNSAALVATTVCCLSANAQEGPQGISPTGWGDVLREAVRHHGDEVDDDGDSIITDEDGEAVDVEVIADFGPGLPLGETATLPDGKQVVTLRVQSIYLLNKPKCDLAYDLHGDWFYLECLISCTLSHEFYHARGTGGDHSTGTPGHIAISYSVTELLCDRVEEINSDPVPPEDEVEAFQREDCAAAFCDYIKQERLKYSGATTQTFATLFANDPSPYNTWPAILPPPGTYTPEDPHVAKCEHCPE